METHAHKEVQTEQIVLSRKKLDLNKSDLLNTPPSELRKEIFKLRSEICEAHEFHDLELKIYQEDNETTVSKKDITIIELQKSLKDAEDIILETNKEISSVKSLNEVLQQQLDEESKNKVILKQQYENQITELQISLEKKSFEIENLEQNKNDFEFEVELMRKNYECRIDELRLALQDYNAKDLRGEYHSCDVSGGDLKDEDGKAEELNGIRCRFEKELKILKDEHNVTLKSLESINESLRQTNQSLVEKLKEANEAVEALKEQLHVPEDTAELLGRQAVTSDLNNSVETCDNELVVSENKVIDSLSILSADMVEPGSVKKEFEGYKFSESKDSFHLAHRTLRYLGALCSQLEESGSSLNLSNSSFDSFDEFMPSSTILEDFAEMEISVVNDATLCSDPLALTRDNTLQTPLKTPVVPNKNPSQSYFKTPLRSVSKPLRTPSRAQVGNVKRPLYPITPNIKTSENNLNEREILQLKSTLAMKDKEIYEVKNMYEKKISESEELLQNSLKSFSLLEERISKLENCFIDLQKEKEKLTTDYFNIQERLNNSIEEIAEIRGKLVVEITSLKPQLEGTLTDVTVPSLLNIFFNTVMESYIAQLTTEMKELRDIKTENEEVILELRKQVKNLENETIKVKVLELIIENLKANGKSWLKMSKSMVKDLSLNLELLKAEKIELKLKILAEVEEASKTRAENEEIAARLRVAVKEFDYANAKLLEFQSAIENAMKTQEIILEKTENSNSNEKTESLSQIPNNVEEVKDNGSISVFPMDLETLWNLQRTPNVVHYEKNGQIMKYTSNTLKHLTHIEKNISELNETRNVILEKYEKMGELRTCISNVVRYLHLPEETLNSEKIISEIEKNKGEIKNEFLERIAVLRQDNQHLDDDNNLLQTKIKKMIEQNNGYKSKISSLEKSEELLKGELLKYKKNKISGKNICYRKLENLEELHQSLIDLLKKILTITGMENLEQLHLFTPRTFEIESRKMFDHFNNWMLKNSEQIRELKSQILELNDECESCAKKIKEDSEQMYKAWAMVRSLEAVKVELENEVKSLKCDLENVQGENNRIPVTEQGTGWRKEMENLKANNISLQSQITVLNNELAVSKKQREELDEECESLVNTIKEEGEKRIKIWEEFQKELKTLNARIEKLEKEKKNLESEKENRTKENCFDQKDGVTCKCGKDLKDVKELRSKIVVRDMRILELEEINEKNSIRKTQMKSLENSLFAIKKKLEEENHKNQKLQAEIAELSSQKGSHVLEVMRKLKVPDFGVTAINQLEEREKLQKLERDNRMLKELCRTRYNEIKRLETENLSLKGHERITKNSNQMDLPIPSRIENSRLKIY